MRLRVAIVLAALLCVPRGASAATLGTFEWVYDVLFASGSTFSVTNESDDSFSDVVVDLYAPEATVPFQSLAFGTIVGGTIAQNIEDLSFLLVPQDIDRAHLTLVVGTEVIALDLLATALTGESTDLLATSIDIVAADPPPTHIPEPPTLLLLAIGLGGFACYRRRARRAPRGKRSDRDLPFPHS